MDNAETATEEISLDSFLEAVEASLSGDEETMSRVVVPNLSAQSQYPR